MLCCMYKEASQSSLVYSGTLKKGLTAVNGIYERSGESSSGSWDKAYCT